MDRRTALNIYLSCVLLGVVCVMGSLWAMSVHRGALGQTLRYTAAALFVIGLVTRFLGSRNRPLR